MVASELNTGEAKSPEKVVYLEDLSLFTVKYVSPELTMDSVLLMFCFKLQVAS